MKNQKQIAAAALAALPVTALSTWIANDYYSPQTTVASYTAFLKLNYVAQPLLAVLLALLAAIAVTAVMPAVSVSRRPVFALVASVYLSTLSLEKEGKRLIAIGEASKVIRMEKFTAVA